MKSIKKEIIKETLSNIFAVAVLSGIAYGGYNLYESQKTHAHTDGATNQTLSMHNDSGAVNADKKPRIVTEVQVTGYSSGDVSDAKEQKTDINARIDSAHTVLPSFAGVLPEKEETDPFAVYAGIPDNGFDHGVSIGAIPANATIEQRLYPEFFHPTSYMTSYAGLSYAPSYALYTMPFDSGYGKPAVDRLAKDDFNGHAALGAIEAVMGSCRYTMDEVNGYFRGIIGGDEKYQTHVTGIVHETSRRFFPFAHQGKTIERGSDNVVHLQLALIRMGAYGNVGRHNDGAFGPATVEAIKNCQRAFKGVYAGIEVDGVASPIFLQALAHESAKNLLFMAHRSRAVAAEYGIDPVGFMRILDLESMTLNPHVASGTGAYGLGQIVPGTYNESARALGFQRVSLNRQQTIMEMMNPDNSLKVAAYYLKEGMAQMGTDNIYMAWAGKYNLGLGNVYTIQRKLGGQGVTKRQQAQLSRALRLNNLSGIPLSRVLAHNAQKPQSAHVRNRVDTLIGLTDRLFGVQVDRHARNVQKFFQGLFI